MRITGPGSDDASALHWFDASIILLWFVTSRLLAATAGVAPDRTVPDILWQLLPLDLLRTRLLESLWYLHSQPPLFNGFVGLLLKLPGDYIETWRAVWVVVGLAIPLTIHASLRMAGASRWLAHAITLAIGLNPTLLLYENFLFYSYPEALCVLLGFYALLAVGHQRGGWVLFALSMALLTLFRATFQPVWAAGVMAATAWSRGSRLRPANWSALAAPLVVGCILAGKNGLMFDVWTSSSWYGMNIAKLAETAMLGETQRLVEEGVVSRVFAVGPFRPVSQYPLPMVQRAADAATRSFGGPPALIVEQKANGQPNFNHAVYIDVSRRLAIESLAAARARRTLFDETLGRGFWYFVQPTSFYTFLDGNRRRVAALDDLYFAVLYPARSFLLVQIALIAAVLTSGAVALFDFARFACLRPAAGFVFVTVLWVAAASNLAEYGENMRLRFSLDPLVAVWFAVLLTRSRAMANRQ